MEQSCKEEVMFSFKLPTSGKENEQTPNKNLGTLLLANKGGIL